MDAHMLECGKLPQNVRALQMTKGGIGLPLGLCLERRLKLRAHVRTYAPTKFSQMKSPVVNATWNSPLLRHMNAFLDVFQVGDDRERHDHQQ
jgi:hypothetical protein